MQIKEKIIKLAEGGYAPPFVTYTPLQQRQVASNEDAPVKTKSEEKKKDDGEVIDEKLMTSLYEKGLPSDVKKFVSETYLLQDDPTGGVFGATSVEKKLRMLTPYLSRMSLEKKQFDKAMETVIANGGMNEIAVNSSGLVYTKDRNGNITPKQLDDVDRSKETILTNAALAQLRAYDPTGAFNSDLTSTITGGIGMKTINEYIQDVTSKMGTSVIKENGYISTGESGQVKKGLDVLKRLGEENPQGLSLDGVYEVVKEKSDKIEQVNAAVRYLTKTMSPQMITILQNKAELSGTTAEDLIVSLATSATSSSYTFTKTFKEDLNPDGSKKKTETGSEDDKIKWTPIMMMGAGNGGEPVKVVLNAGTSMNTNYEGMSYGNPTGIDNKTITEGSVKNALLPSLGPLVDPNSVYFGDNYVSPVDLDKLMYDGSGLTRVMMPFVNDNGKIKPDLGAGARLSKVVDTINKMGGNVSIQQLNNILANNQLEGAINFDSEGKIVYNDSKVRPFMAINGYGATDDGVISDEDSSYLVDVNRVGDVNKTADWFKKIYKTEKTEGNVGTGFYFNRGNEIFKGTIYMPILKTQGMQESSTGQYPVSIGYKDPALIDANVVRSGKLSTHVSGSSDKI